MDEPIIQLAKMQFCHNESCHMSKELHLCIEIFQVKLSASKAVAISYTWGEFDREKVVIGHDADGNSISMTLGKEWNIQELVFKLAEICNENQHAACWIDQLCIAQTNDEELRNTLAKIPSIYRTLSVVILMPGGICSCLREMAKTMWERDGTIKPIEHWWRNWLFPCKAFQCANAGGLCSYFDRVWTRQELLYSRSVKVVRTCNDEAPCVTCVTDARFLAPFADRLFTRYMLEGFTEEMAFGKVIADNVYFMAKSLTTMGEFNGPDRVREGAMWERVRQVELLLGKTVTRTLPENPQNESRRLSDFLDNLKALGKVPRRATKACDYVASVWVDCPGYILPINFKTRGLPNLLEDAIRQLEDNHRVSVQVNCMGLFGSLLWRPSNFLGKKRILATDEIYSVVEGGWPIPLTTGGDVPLRIVSPHSTALSRYATRYSNLFSSQPPIQVFEALKAVLRNWPNSIIIKFSDAYGKFFTRQSANEIANPDLSMSFLGSLLVHEGNRRGLCQIATRSFWNGHPEVDHYRATYQMVTMALGLDINECQNRGLELMISPLYPPCIGLMKIELVEQNIENALTICTESLNSAHISQEDTMEYGRHLLEGIKRGGSPVARVEIVGSWVPLTDCCHFEPGAFIEAGCRDGVLRI